MDSIEKNVKILLASIMKSEAYQEYKKQEEKLKQDPGLLEKVDRFRISNFRVQNQSDPEHMFEEMNRLEQESKELRKIPQVNAYLDAELAVCRLMQKIFMDLSNGIQMHIPDL